MSLNFPSFKKEPLILSKPESSPRELLEEEDVVECFLITINSLGNSARFDLDNEVSLAVVVLDSKFLELLQELSARTKPSTAGFVTEPTFLCSGLFGDLALELLFLCLSVGMGSA